MQTPSVDDPHEWMVNQCPERVDRKKGMMVWIAEVFTTLGSGYFLVSLFMGNWWGMALADHYHVLETTGPSGLLCSPPLLAH